MENDIRKRVYLLLEELLSNVASEKRENDIVQELDQLLPDPKWSDYIFWSEDYVNDDGSIKYDKFFKKVFDYKNSKEFKVKQRIIKLVNLLLGRDFSEISEVEIVNEINRLSPDINWMNYIFADKSCLNSDGSVNKDKFLEKIFS